MNRRWLFLVWKIPLVENMIEDKILKSHVCTSLNTAKKKAILVQKINWHNYVLKTLYNVNL